MICWSLAASAAGAQPAVDPLIRAHDLYNQHQYDAAIRAAAEARTDSRGAHFREDFPQTGDLATSAFSRVRMEDDKIRVSWQNVEFAKVRPGESLVVPKIPA